MDLSNITVNAQSSIRIAGSKTIYFDPFEITNEAHDADVIFVTHEHFDHFDVKSIEKIKRADTVIVAPLTMQKLLQRELPGCILELWEPGTSHEVLGLAVLTVPAYNNLKPFHTRGSKWQGYLLHMDDTVYFVAGDTDVNRDNEKVHCDVALVPVGGKFTMDKKQAAEYIAAMKPKAAIPTHYGKVVGNAADGADFKSLVEAAAPDIQVELRL